DGRLRRSRADGLPDRPSRYVGRRPVRLESRICRPCRSDEGLRDVERQRSCRAFRQGRHVYRAPGRQGSIRLDAARRFARTARRFRLRVSDGVNSRELEWNVYDSGPGGAKNVILVSGDGMSLAHRVGARVLAKGIAEGKARGKLAIDDMPHMALVAAAGSDSIITDSANSASAYATGHKSAVNAMGVYAD